MPLPDKTYKLRPIFNPAFYLLKHDDLIRAFGINNYREAAGHWMFYGRNEGRASSPCFNVSYYLNAHVDLVNAFGQNNFLAAIDHWHVYGINEGRQSCLEFSPKFYLDSHVDLQNAFGQKNYHAALDHWINYGLREGRQGSPDFSIREKVSQLPRLENLIQREENKTGYLFAWALYFRNCLNFNDNLPKENYDDLENALGIAPVHVVNTCDVKPVKPYDYFDCFSAIGAALATGFFILEGGPVARAAAGVIAVRAAFDAYVSCSDAFSKSEKAIENPKERKKEEEAWTNKVNEHVDNSHEHLDKHDFGDYPPPSFKYA